VVITRNDAPSDGAYQAASQRPVHSPTVTPRTRRTVVVTGGTAGLGRALALRFARAGYKIGLIARDGKALMDVAQEVLTQGGDPTVVAADVADADAMFAAADRIAADLGPIDIWINNAMVTVFSTVADISPQEFRRVTEVTYLGFVHGTMSALRHMRPRGSGRIIQIGSALAYRGIPLQAAYCGAKHAIRGFTDSLRSELVREGSRISLTMIQLPAMNTPQFDWARTHRQHEPRPVGPIMQPDAVADAIFRVAHGRRREYWIGTSTIETIVGAMAFPSFLDRYLARHAYEDQDRRSAVAPDRRDNLDEPIYALHRVRGSFDDEARSSVLLVSGAAVRAGIAALGIMVILIGAALIA
jgi:NAD(P)-dependent dehydrogenase (short-subunit alcohol dehydrogenase family)